MRVGSGVQYAVLSCRVWSSERVKIVMTSGGMNMDGCMLHWISYSLALSRQYCVFCYSIVFYCKSQIVRGERNQVCGSWLMRTM